MTGYNYPDNLYDDALAKQTPTSACGARNIPRHHIASAIDNLAKAIEYLQVTVRVLQRQTLDELAAESQKLGLYDEPLDYLASFGPNKLRGEVLRESGIGDVRPVMAAEADRLSGDVL